MSLNKLITEGKVSQGLDLDIRSITTAPDAVNNINGSLTVNQFDVDGITNLNGGMTLDNKKVFLNGTQTAGTQGLIFNGLSDTGSFDFKYQKYNDVLHISGVVYGDVTTLLSSTSLSFLAQVPNGYTITGPFGATRFFSVSGGGCSVLGPTSSKAVYVAGLSYPVSATSYRITFFTGTGNPSLDLAGQTVLSFSVYLIGVNG